MATADDIATGLVGTIAERSLPSQRRLSILRPALALVVGYFILVCAIVLVSWLYGDWRDFDIFQLVFPGLGSVFGILGIIVLLVYRGRSISNLPIAAQAMLAALQNPTDDTLPILRPQPEPMSMALTSHRKLIGPLPYIRMGPQALQWWHLLFQLGIFVTFFIDFQLVKLPDIVQANVTTYAQFERDVTPGIDIAMVCIGIFSMGMALFANFLWSGWQLRYDARGLLWPRYRHWQRMAWDEIRTIGCYTHAGSAYQPPTVAFLQSQTAASLTYVIASDTQVITWSMVGLTKPKEIETTARFLALVMKQTGLPLRDLTPLADALAVATEARAATHPAFARTSLAGHVSARSRQPSRFEKQLEQRAFTMLDAIAPVQRNPRWYVNVFITAGLMLCLWASFGAAMAIYHIAMPDYLATLPGQIQHQTPLLADALTVPDGRWPIQKPTATNHTSITYSPGGYTLSGSQDGNAVVALLPDIYHAVAIQVTVTTIGSPSGGANDDVGIIMRHTNWGDCAFVIDPAGNWGDTCMRECDGGFSPYIHSGSGATNTLLAVVRGFQHILYINGQYVGQCADSAVAPLGRIGLINEGSDIQATFTDFTVWPVPAPPSFNYV